MRSIAVNLIGIQMTGEGTQCMVTVAAFTYLGCYQSRKQRCTKYVKFDQKCQKPSSYFYSFVDGSDRVFEESLIDTRRTVTTIRYATGYKTCGR